MAGLPTVMGSLSALGVAFLSLSAGVSTPVLVSRMGAAFAVFYAFGMVMRHLLQEALIRESESAATGPGYIQPGTPVGELLEGEQNKL